MNALPSFLLPADEPARRRALERYQLLDARRETILDEVVAVAAQLFRVSNALLSIVEDSTVLVKAPYQLPVQVERVPRQHSLCSATILQSETVVFEDLARQSAPGIDITAMRQLGLCFYAGHNLRTPDGYHIGTLCLYDNRARYFSPDERRLLAQLAGLVMHLLELRRLLGPHTGLTGLLWANIYCGIDVQLGYLRQIAAQAGPAGTPLAPGLAREASRLVASIDQLVSATLRR